MKTFPSELLIAIFEQFLPPLVTAYDTAAANDMPLEDQAELFKNLVFYKLVCRRWREVIEEHPSLFSRDAHYVTEASRDGLTAKGKYAKRLVVGDVNKVGYTSDRDLAVFPNVAYVSWTCGVSQGDYFRGCGVAYPPLNHLRRLDWAFSGSFGASVDSFIRLVQHCPVLEYITLTVAEPPLRGNDRRQIKFDVPDSVTTLGLFFRRSVLQLGLWIVSKWFTGPAASLKHFVTSGSFAPPLAFSTVELRPDPYCATQPSKSALQHFLRNRLPQDGSNGTLIYSGATYAPPASNDLVATERLKWVHKIVLKTSGSRHRTEDEKWDAVQQHLDFILKQFRNLKSIDLCGDFRGWREDEVKGKVLEVFEKSAREFGVTVKYIK